MPSSTLGCCLAPTEPVGMLLPLTCSNDHFPPLLPRGRSPPPSAGRWCRTAHPLPSPARIVSADRSTPVLVLLDSLEREDP
ncbi:hypothetical protein NDU88_002433 [Pleurodeles waltl]|uniref:Uncharacterized protein n=1 Tax=Pleurodeles waltl TaxID=8319 RepID=A0AAV7Q6L7_PLEWA|nr:hypothetical protein NDU88_002433 [Pleurodeles waltl]